MRSAQGISRCQLLLLCLSTPLSWSRQPQIEQLLDDIAGAYEPIQGVFVRLVMEEDPRSSEEVGVSADGRFGSLKYDRRVEPPTLSITFVDDTSLIVDVPAGYSRTRLERLPERRTWWAGQWAAPWPMVPSWIGAIRTSADAEIAIEGDALRVGSPALQLRLSFDVNSFALEQIETYSASVVAFSDFDWSVAPPMPMTTTLIVDLPARGPQTPATLLESRMVYAEREFNPPDIEAKITFDPQAYHIDRYDPASGNVYDSNNNVKYNYDQYARDMIRGATMAAKGDSDKKARWSMSTWILAFGIAGLLVAAAVYLVRWRRRRPA